MWKGLSGAGRGEAEPGGRETQQGPGGGEEARAGMGKTGERQQEGQGLEALRT